MKTSRKVVACVVLLTIAGVHAACFVVRKDFWPFSHYEMYAGVRGPTWSTVEIAGIASTPAAEDVKLPTEGVRPPRTVRVLTGLNRLVRQSEVAPVHRPRLERALRTAAALYNRELPSVQKNFVPLKGLRLYREDWVRETGEDGRHHWRMISREKIAEVFLEV